MKVAILCVFLAGAVVGVTSCPSWRSVSYSAASVSAEGMEPDEKADVTAREEAYGYFGAGCMRMLEARDLEDQGKAALADQAWRAAAAALEQAVQRDPGSVDICRALAGAYMRLHETQKASDTLQKLSAALPGSPETHIEIADAYRMLNRNAEALAEYEKAAELSAARADATWSAAMSGMAGLYRAMGTPAKAVPLLQQMVDKRPEDASLKLDLAFALADCVRHDDAIAVAQPLIGENTRLDPASLVRAYFFLAGEYEKAGRTDEGLRVFADLAKGRPDSGEICQARMQLLASADRIEDALALGAEFLAGHKDADAIRLLTAALYEKSGEPERALQLYREGVAEDEPFRSIAARQLLLMSMRLGEDKKSDLALKGLEFLMATGDLDEAIRIEARLQAAIVYRQKGQPEKAIDVLKPLIATAEKGNWRVGVLYADFLRTSGKPDQAVTYLEEMLTHHAKEADALEGIHFSLALIYQTPGLTDNKKAEEHLRAALAADPGSASAANGLGYLLAQEGRNLDEAEKLLKMALLKQPKEAAFLDSLGFIYYKQALRDDNPARLRQAVENLQAAADGDVNAIVYNHLADAAFVSGDWEKAKTYWEKALNTPVDPGDEKIDRALVQRELAMVTSRLADELKQFGKPRGAEARLVRPLVPPSREAPTGK